MFNGVMILESCSTLYRFRKTNVVIGDPGRVLKNQVSGFDFKKPGSGFGFSKMAISGFKNRQIGAFWSKNSQISLEITILALFGPQNGGVCKFFLMNSF